VDEKVTSVVAVQAWESERWPGYFGSSHGWSSEWVFSRDRDAGFQGAGYGAKAIC